MPRRKIAIITFPEQSGLLNKRLELISKCKHKNISLLSHLKIGDSKDLINNVYAHTKKLSPDLKKPFVIQSIFYLTNKKWKTLDAKSAEYSGWGRTDQPKYDILPAWISLNVALRYYEEA